jgi:hypothetical protein
VHYPRCLTKWIKGYPAPTKSAEETKKAFLRFLGTDIKAKYVYTDNSLEFEKAMDEIGFSHDTSIPYRRETNGIAESVRRVKEGTTCTLVQSGFIHKWRDLAMEC